MSDKPTSKVTSFINVTKMQQSAYINRKLMIGEFCPGVHKHQIKQLNKNHKKLYKRA